MQKYELDEITPLPVEMASLSALVVTFNCGRELIKPDVFSRHLVNELPGLHANSPEIVIISLQEVAPIAYAFLGGPFLRSYISKIHQTVELAGKAWGHHYSSLSMNNVGMTVIVVFVRVDVAKHIRTIETGGTGVGWKETGNKGAVGIRLGYAIEDGMMDLTFLAAHLAPHEKMLKRRNEDWMNIVKRVCFFVSANGKTIQSERKYPRASAEEVVPLLRNGDADEKMLWSGIYAPTSHLIVAGDLNYRTSDKSPTPEDYESYPRLEDRDYSNLLQQDQLGAETRAEATLHGLSEADILFPPSYKYSDKKQVQAGIQEAKFEKKSAPESEQESDFGWAVHRWPSWCDRILYRDTPPWVKDREPQTKITIHKYTSLPLMSTSDHRPVLLSLSIPLKRIPLPPKEYVEKDWHVRPPYAIDPEWRQKRAAARRREIVLGLVAYFGLTWEGNGFLIATILGALGGWAIIKGILIWTEK